MKAGGSFAGEGITARGVVFRLQPLDHFGHRRQVIHRADALVGAPDVAPCLGLGIASGAEIVDVHVQVTHDWSVGAKFNRQEYYRLYRVGTRC